MLKISLLFANIAGIYNNSIKDNGAKDNSIKDIAIIYRYNWY